MPDLFEYIGIAMYLIIPGAVLYLFLNIIYRRIKGKSIHSAGSTFVGEHIFKIWETGQRKSAVEEIQYQREEAREEDDSGDPPEPGDDR